MRISVFTLMIVIGFGLNTKAQTTGIFKDSRDGKEYKTVEIGKQVWMSENLAYKASNNCWAYNNDEKNVAKYGYLYGVYTSTKVCPAGWHLPTDAEWTQLEKYLMENSFSYNGVKDNKGIAKSLATDNGWSVSDKEGAVGNKDFLDYRNKSGFSALPGGQRETPGGAFYDLGSCGYWWTATGAMIAAAYNRAISSNISKVSRDENNNLEGASVRCVKD